MKRIPVKWIRDKAKSAYEKDSNCYICNTTENLELHHLFSITELFENWCIKESITITSDEDALGVRDAFIAIHYKEIYEDVVTLCKKHHALLHSIFGIRPELSSAPKQRQWIEIQKNKPPLDFSQFIG